MNSRANLTPQESRLMEAHDALAKAWSLLCDAYGESNNETLNNASLQGMAAIDSLQNRILEAAYNRTASSRETHITVGGFSRAGVLLCSAQGLDIIDAMNLCLITARAIYPRPTVDQMLFQQTI